METLTDLLEESTQRFGNATALVIKPGIRQQRWSYARLWDYSGRLASVLEQRGLARGERVIIWAPNRPEWVVALFGCLRAGLIVVPLDLRSAPDFVDKVVQQTAARLAFLSRHTPEGLSSIKLPVLLLEELEGELEAAPAAWPGSAPEPDDLAEVIFTSGTTGDPKGVMLTHRNILANVLAVTRLVPVLPSYRLLSLLPLSHMLEQTIGLFAPLLGGATVYYPVSRQPRILFKAMGEHAITTVVLVPQVLDLFMNAIHREVRAGGREGYWPLLLSLAARLPMPLRRLLFASVHHQLGGRLNLFISGGAYLDPALAANWRALGVHVLQGYGATEASPVISTDSFRARRNGAVGKALPGQEIRIAGDGEILIRGPNVTRGYWQNPEATAAAFEDGWYRTGDLGYLDQEGFLHLRGRKKDLIVLASGENVYPEDIENLLRKQPGVRDCAVLGLPRNATIEVHAALLLDDLPTQQSDDHQQVGRVETAVRAVNQALAPHQRVRGFTIWPDDDFPRTHTLKVKKAAVLEGLLPPQKSPFSQGEGGSQRSPLPEGGGSG